MTWIIGLVLTALAVVAFFVLAWWGLPFLLVAAVLYGVYVLNSRKKGGDPTAGTIERGRKEPTGTIRKAHGDAETANERVGQA
jgi:hypothetical protein